MENLDGITRAPNRLLDYKWAAVAILFITLICAWVYAPVLTSNYGWNDDYHLLKRVAERSFDLRNNEDIEGGRPLLGLATRVLFYIPRSVDTFKRARYVSVAGIIVFALCAFASLRRIGFGHSFSATAALMMCLTPGFAVYAGWLTDGFNSFAAMFALVAGQLIGLTGEPACRRRIWLLLVASILLLAAYATYQPVAAFAVIPLLAMANREFKIDWRRVRAFILGVAFILLIAAIYFVAYKLLVKALHLGGQAERGALTSHLFDNLRFVATQILWSGLTGWSLFNPSWVQCLIAALVCLIILVQPGKDLAAHLPGFVCLAIALGLSVLPMLLVQGQQFAFRTQTALHAIIGFAFVLGLERWLRNVSSMATSDRLRKLAFASVLFVTAALTRHHLAQDFVAPSVREVAALTAGIEQMKSFPTKLVYIDAAQATSPGDNLAEFGYTTGALPWVTPAMLEILFIGVYEHRVSLHRALQLHAGFEVRFGPWNPDSLPVLDGATLIDGPAAEIKDAYWGTLRTNKNGWCASPWFGVFDNRRFPTIYHSELGWLECSGRGIDEFSFWSPQYGAFSTSPQTYPLLRFKDRASSFRLGLDIAPTPSFYDVKRKQWTISPQSK